MLAAGRSSTSIPDPAAVISLLHAGLACTVQPEAVAWLDTELERQRGSVDERRLVVSLGLAGRKVGRADLVLSDTDRAAARSVRASWQPEWWGSDEAVRVALVLATYRGDDEVFAARIERLCAAGGVTELVAYLKGFAVFPAPVALNPRAREGARASMRPPFEAIACRNPFPFDYFDEAAWNQMVVKCVFTGISIETIVGLRERRNPEVVRILRDLVAERTAAGRPLPDEVHSYIDSRY